MILAVDPTMFVGLSLDDARAQIAGYGYSHRVTGVDGVSIRIRMDYDPLRINMKIQNNRVTSATLG